ncbi:MAG: sensor histidine kinase CheA associated with MCPs of class [Ilumatobacteraceae bacterium]|nr:sensor histidine kinase CheA associated with MCPs of class [Ilumatobacteraceae bacterium]
MSLKGLAHLRSLFAQEAEQRLARLGQLVLELELTPLDGSAELIAEIFREVHTLKGSAAVVGFETVGEFAHAIEDKLGQLRAGSTTATASIIDALLIVLDRLGTVIWESVAEETVDTAINDQLLDQFNAAFAAPAEGSDEVAPPADTATADSEAHTEDVPSPVADQHPGQTAVAPVVAAVTDGPAPARSDRPNPSSLSGGGGTVMVPIERLDDLVRLVGEAAAAHLRVGRVLTERIGVEAIGLAEFGELSRVLNDLQERTMRTRMVPVSTITDQLQRAVRDASRSLGKDVTWEVRGDSTELDRAVLTQLSDSLLHLVRNAVDHGIESAESRAAAGKPPRATIRLHAMQLGSEVTIAVSDDGGGIDLERVRQQALRTGIDVDGLSDDETMQLIFRSGFSTSSFVSDISGRGVGLDAVRSSVEAARGRVEVRSTVGVGSEFRVVVPVTLAVLRCLLVDAAGRRFALPLHQVVIVQSEDQSILSHAEGRQVLMMDSLPVPVADLAQLLGMESTRTGPATYVVLNANTGRCAFAVDALVGQRDVVVKGFGALMPRLEVVAGASVEPDGSILVVLDPSGLVNRSRRDTSRNTEQHSTAPETMRRRGRLLVVDDALTVRELQRTILQRAGFDVRVAVDGMEALERLAEETFDLVLTDVEMPRMNGFELTEHIRALPSSAHVAVLILTSLASDADRRRGMEAGADGYIVKSSFDEQSLLAAVDRLIGLSV